jgi:cyclic pyranopterin phosphate synthase
MSEEMKFLPRAKLLTLEELTIISRAFVELGVDKIRITGGEPLIRKNITKLFQDIGQLPGLRELVTTTNGSQLPKLARQLKDAGVKRINISLDSLNAEKFKRITRTGKLEDVLAGIQAALDVGFERIKLNTVILKNRNDDEIMDLVQFAIDKNIDISFIEEMPLGLINDHDRAEVYYSSDQIRTDIEKVMTLIPTTESTGGPAKYFKIPGTEYIVNRIRYHTQCTVVIYA